MSEVIQFPFKGRKDARTDRRRSNDDAKTADHGSIRFVVNGDGDTDMHVTGVFEKRLQFGVYTMIKGVARLCDKIVQGDGAGHFTAGPIHEQLQASRRRGTPRRLREWTGFGELD